MKALTANGATVELDGEGYLVRFEDWNEDIARQLAEEDKLELTSDHWTVMQLLREYFTEYETIPPARTLADLTKMKLGSAKGNNRYLTTLFPQEHLKQGARIAGLPRMPGCT